MAELLEIENLRVRFRRLGPIRAMISGGNPYLDAVLDVGLSIKSGETFGLVGESGSGKTTLGRTIIGLIHPVTGSIKFAGAELTKLTGAEYKRHRRQIAMMFQDAVASLSPRRTVRSLLTEPFRIHRMAEGKDLEAEAVRLLGMVGLPASFLGRYPHELSGGQARRVGVARALSLSPKLIIADEPTAGLDVSVQGEILNLLARLQADMGLSYLIITHNLPVIRHVSDRIAIMYMGRLVEQGPTQAIYAKPSHHYTKALLSGVPEPDPAKRRQTVSIEGEVPSLSNRPPGCEFHTRCSVGKGQDICRRVVPERTEVRPDHWVRCHFPLG